MKSPINLRNNRLQDLYGLGAVLVVATIGLSLAFQGWNSRLMNFDHVNFIDAAHRLLSDGILPDRGDVSSYLAFATPGTAWLMVPGMVLFDDPRLYEFVGSASLYVGTLFGLFRLARICFGLRCAYLSVLLYGLSRNGLFNAGSLWSIGHPFFFIWMVYFCIHWVQRNNSTYLAAAIVTWSVGMYVDMVLAPAVFALPAMWIIYRPRVSITPLLLGALIISAIWYPYLRFESTRNFSDLKSIVARQRMAVTNYDWKASWCVPTLVIKNLNAPAGLASSELEGASQQIAGATGTQSQSLTWYETLKEQIRLKSAIVKEGITFNFDQMAWTPSLARPLLLLAMTTLVVSALQGATRGFLINNSRTWVGWIPRLAWMLIFLAVLGNEGFVAHFLSTNGSLAPSTVLDIRTLQAGLLLTGSALLLWKRQIAEFIRHLIVQQSEQRGDLQNSSAVLFTLALVVPWLVLIMVVEAGQFVRYFWLWPLQMVLIVAAVTYIPKRLGWPRSVAWLGQISLTLLLLTHPWVVSPVRAWVKNDWSGPRASDIQAVDYIASQVRSQGRNQVAIGYQTFIVGFMAIFNFIDPRYKVGAELDLFLKHRYKISNSNQCAEGVSPYDEYRIVQKAPKHAESENLPISWAPFGNEIKTYDLVEYFDTPLDSRFRMLRQFGDFKVFQRIPLP